MKTLLKSLLIGLSIGFLLTPVAQADPPRWAPAYGYRYKHNQDHRYRYHRYDKYRSPLYSYRGYYNTRCNGEVLGTVLGSAVGGTIGSRAANDRAMGTITGVFVGAVVGNVIGRSLDETDRRCGSNNYRKNEKRYRTWRR